MNSDYTVYDRIIMDPNLTKTVPRDQYFYTGMDAYIHCVEALSGSYRNAIGDALSRETINLCRNVFNSENMMSKENKRKVNGCFIFRWMLNCHKLCWSCPSFICWVKFVLGIHHCLANCIVMRAMQEFYPDAYGEFWKMVEKQNIKIPKWKSA